MEKPKLSYSRLEEKPLLFNQAAIEAAVEHLNKHDAYYYQGLPEFEADDKFKDYYIQEHNREPEQEDIQKYVVDLIMECVEENKKEQERVEKSKESCSRVNISQGQEYNSKKRKKKG